MGSKNVNAIVDNKLYLNQISPNDHKKTLLLRSALSDQSSSSFSHRSTTLLDLTGRITRDSDYYSACGGSADIWKGKLLKDIDNCKVRLGIQFVLFTLNGCRSRLLSKLSVPIATPKMVTE
jgi:hypothetical protein